MGKRTAQSQLAEAIHNLTPSPDHPALAHLVASLRDRHGDCVRAILFYGSCLRSGDPYDGLVDLYLVVRSYRCANARLIKSVWNWLLPPNVFYTEFPHNGRTVRSKYAVISLDQLDRGTSHRWFHSYLWGRFSQPTAVAWWHDDATRTIIDRSLAQAVVTFLNRVLPALPAQGSVQSLWNQGLQLSYTAELRVESSTRARELSDANKTYYQQVTRVCSPLLNFPCEILGRATAQDYRTQISRARRFSGRLGWKLRTVQGKLLSLARLVKALFTFDGGLDYIAWKLERHSGVRVDIPERVRRHPLIFVWGLFWDLYKRGVFR